MIAYIIARYKNAPAPWQWAAFIVMEFAIGGAGFAAVIRFGVWALPWSVLASLIPVAAVLFVIWRARKTKSAKALAALALESLASPTPVPLAASKEPPPATFQGDLNRLKELEPLWRSAVQNALDFIVRTLVRPEGLSETDRLLLDLLSYPAASLKQARSRVDIAMAERDIRLVGAITVMLVEYEALVGYIERAGPMLTGGEVEFRESGWFRAARERNSKLTAALYAIRNRDDFGPIALYVADLEKLLTGPNS